MKKLLKTHLGVVTAMTLIALAAPGSAFAQDSTGTSGTGSGTTVNSSESRDNGTNWSWLGLLGLAGLAGLRRPQTTVVRRDAAV